MIFDIFDHPSIGALVLRILLGSLLVIHGYPKLRRGQEQAMSWMESMGLPKVLVPLTVVLEFMGGIFILIGFLTPIVGILVVLEFAGIISQGRKLGKKSRRDYELELFFLGGALAMIFLSAGSYSVDHLLGF